MERIRHHWRILVVAGTFLPVMMLYRTYGSSMDVLGASILGALPIGVAARLYGPRAAAAVLSLAVGANADLIVESNSIDTVTIAELVEGVVLCVLGLIAGAALADKQRITKTLLTDTATGLANREGLLVEIERLMRTGDPRLTLAMVHVPELSEISETFGDDVWHEVLRTITARIRSVAQADGFAVKGVRDLFAIAWRSQPREDPDVARALIDCASGMFDVQGISLKLTAYAAVGRQSVVGAASPEDLIRATQRALDRARQTSREWLAAERVTEAGRSRLVVVNELRQGVTDGQLRLHYQPIIELPSRKVRGLEALVRWEHPKRGLVPPAEFIPLAEQSGLIVQITEWVLHEVMRQMLRWDTLGLRPQIAVNVGAKALASSARLPETVDRLLGSYGVEPGRIVLEVTETDVMTDPGRAIAVLNALKALGVRIEVDDFGTGYSSLAYLRQLPLDGVKIDRSFVRTLVTDANTSAIVRAAIDLSHALGLEAVAEGVEDEDALARLIASGCDLAQGFLFARPMPADAVPAWLAVTGGSVADNRDEPMPAAVKTGATVLLVDDEPRLRLSTFRMLSGGGYQVLAAATASEALQIYSAHGSTVSVVLTDMHLTDWRGHELADRLREIRPDLRVVYMSGDSRELKNAGADQFLVKPFSKRDLLDGIAQALAA